MTSKTKKNAADPASYRERNYRLQMDSAGLVSFRIMIKETDLHILATSDLSAAAHELTMQARHQIERYIAANPRFLSSLVPLPLDPAAPGLVKIMLQAAMTAEVGPMAAVAGAIAEQVGQGLLAKGTPEVIVENGGDIFLHRAQACTAGIFAAASPFSSRIGIKISRSRMPLGICTSSGTVGHSLSFGCADSVTVLAPSTALADAAATRLGNEVRSGNDIDPALQLARTLPGLSGALIVKDDRLGAWGDVELVPLD